MKDPKKTPAKKAPARKAPRSRTWLDLRLAGGTRVVMNHAAMAALWRELTAIPQPVPPMLSLLRSAITDTTVHTPPSPQEAAMPAEAQLHAREVVRA